MNIYDKYLEEIKQRKTQGLHPKPIDNSELLDQIKLFQTFDKKNFYPTIICTDINNSQFSEAYNKIKGKKILASQHPSQHFLIMYVIERQTQTFKTINFHCYYLIFYIFGNRSLSQTTN